MIALHPPISGLPLAFILLLAVIEGMRFSERFRDALVGARHVLVCATVVVTSAAFLSGYQASGAITELAPVVEGELATHHAYGRALLINALLLGTFAWLSQRAQYGRKVIEFLYWISLLIQLFLTVLVGSLGGALVFDRGLGVTMQPVLSIPISGAKPLAAKETL